MPNPVTLEEFRGLLAISKDRLDEELEVHPQLLWMVSEQLARANDRRDKAKNELSITQAEAADEYRQQYKQVTDKRIQELVGLDENVLEALDAYQKEKKIADLWVGMLAAFQRRGSMLRDLVELYVHEYWTKDYVRSENEGTRLAHNKKLASEGRQRMKERRDARRKESRRVSYSEKL